MSLRSSLAAIVLTTGFSALMVGPALAADRDCADFASQADAQAALEADPSDPERLDADDDGQACESFDYAGGGQVAAVPRDGVAAGDGSAAADDAGSLPYLLGSLSLAAAGGAAYAARRSARGSA
jgi:hypothetical protein